MPYERFIKSDDEFIIKNYADNGAKYCSLFVENKTIKQICDRARYLGLRISEERLIVKNLNNAEILWKDKIINDKLEFDKFTDLTCAESIYFLGYLWADGHLSKVCNEVILRLQLKDAETIKFNILKIPLSFNIRYQNNIKGDKIENSMSFSISNRYLHQFLKDNDYGIKTGTSPNKILSLIPEYLKHYWWRGYFDGDGCVHPTNGNRIFFTSCYEQDWEFLSEIENKLNIKFKINKLIKKLGKASTASIYKKDQIIIFKNYIYRHYENDKIGLDRKYIKFKLIKYKNQNI